MGERHDEPSDEPTDEPTESPATWENIIIGELKEVIGKAVHDKKFVEEGEEQVEIAHHVREEYREEQED